MYLVSHVCVFVIPSYLATGHNSSLAASTVMGSTVKGEIRKDKLQDVAGKSCWEVKNTQDNKWKPRSSQEAVTAALSSVGKERMYNLSSSNCEHFATESRYGKGESVQVCIVQ